MPRYSLVGLVLAFTLFFPACRDPWSPDGIILLTHKWLEGSCDKSDPEPFQIELLVIDDALGIRALDSSADLLPGSETVSTPGKCEMTMSFSFVFPVTQVYHYDITEKEDSITGTGAYEQVRPEQCTQAFEVEGRRLVDAR